MTMSNDAIARASKSAQKMSARCWNLFIADQLEKHASYFDSKAMRKEWGEHYRRAAKLLEESDPVDVKKLKSHIDGLFELIKSNCEYDQR